MEFRCGPSTKECTISVVGDTVDDDMLATVNGEDCWNMAMSGPILK